MAECRICRKPTGLLSGGIEPYTGNKLNVCNECGAFLKNFEALAKQGKFEECKSLIEKLFLLSKDSEIRGILKVYAEKIICDDIEQEEKEQSETPAKEWEERNKRREELMERAQIQYKKNAYYEYCVESITDSKATGALSKDQLQWVLAEYALDGWRLHTAFTNELGKNALEVLGFGINATVEETILIFERCIKAADNPEL